ncbi:MAG TPA: ribosome silencing factor [Alphaproteobacteria bacterium]|nr:ribosome silencing factor [Alphaproteobacteria bacterium]
MTIARRTKTPPSPKKLLQTVKESLADDQAEAIVVIELDGKSSIADYMVIASGRSQRHVAATADHLIERLKAAGMRPVPSEGRTQGDWVLIDGGDVIVHLFRPEVREFYNLEKMWGQTAPEAAGTAELIA